jgi:hypothetical protein
VSIALAVVAHTNVGKTTLVRTLLKRDIGEVADRPHVTEDAERHALLETAQGDALYLWDTPGFGDSARLLKRLRTSGNPLGWMLTQVWDRFADRPFFCSQRAVAAVRDGADVVLYLVNAAEDPAAAAYVDAELEILRWVGKPVLLLLNQSGPPRPREAEAADEARWSRQLAQHVASRGVVTLDAFARCWVQEDRVWREVAALLDAGRRPEMQRLREAWRTRNLETFHAAMASLARHLAAIAGDRESVPEKIDPGALAQGIRNWWARRSGASSSADPVVARAMSALGARLEARLRANTDELIALHGLAGRAQESILERSEGHFDVALPADVAGTGIVGGVVSGALGGLAADLSAGGLTLGAGVVIGAILGALGAGSAARAYNMLQGQEDGSVRWGGDFLLARVRAAILRYLAVAHFGRGRGEWVEGEAPAHWRTLIDELVAARAERLREVFASAEGEASLAGRLQPELAELGRAALARLYPESLALFAGASAESSSLR